MDRSLVTILVVDEEILVRRVLETLLERDGFSVLSTRNVSTALQLMISTTLPVLPRMLPNRTTTGLNKRLR